MAREDLGGQVGGGGYDDFVFTVTDAYFGPSPAFTEKTGQEAIFCHWLGTTDMEDVPTLDDDGFHPSYTLGADWEVTNDGKSVKYLGTGKERLGKWYGRVLDEILEFTQDVPQGQHPFDGDNHPRDAVHWIGTRWRMKNKEYEWGGDFGKSEKLVPVEYLGRVDVSSPGATATATANAAAPANDGLRDQVLTLAKGASDYKTFQSAALAVPGVSSNPSLLAEIIDENKLYSEANA